ncbi:MAG: hypothetical protein QM753_15930 [Thermomicrobiales bacterium]
MPFYGRKISSGDLDMGDVGVNTQVASVYNRMPTNGWATKLGIWGGKATGTNSVFKLAVWSVDASKNPTNRLFLSGNVTVSTAQSYGGDGASYEVPMSLKLTANERYSLGVVATNADGHFAMVQAAYNSSADNNYMYRKYSVSTPANPNGYTSNSYEGWLSMWIEYVANSAPTAAITSPSGLVTTNPPAFQATFSDADAAYGDKLSAYRIQVVRVSDNVAMWDSGTIPATTTEQTNSAVNRAYGGSALSPSVNYQWRIQVADQHNVWSAWTSYTTFSINGGGSFSNFTSPTGKVTTKQPTPFSAKWTHANTYAMNRMQVRIRQSSAIVLTSAEVAKTVANNATASATWTELFSTSTLNYGIEYQWEIRGRDNTDNLWSQWSSPQTFRVNGAPTVPASLTPANGNAFTTRPKLRCVVTDPDNDTLTVTARVTRVSTSTTTTATMTHVGSGVYEFQTTSTQIPAYDNYTWSAISYDGSLYSGEATSSGSAARSAEAAFTYAQGPVVNVTSPTSGQVYTNSWLTVTWDAVPNWYRTIIYVKFADGTPFQTLDTTNSGNSWTLSGGWPWINATDYTVQVAIEDTSHLIGYSSVIPFRIDWGLSQVANVQASPEFMAFDNVPSAVRLTWSEATPQNIGGNFGTFSYYLVWRRVTGEPFSNAKLLSKITSSTTTSFVDYTPLSGVNYTYSVQQVQQFYLNELASTPTDVQLQIDLEGVVLQDVDNSYHALLTLRPEREFDHVDDVTSEQVWGLAAPTFLYGTAQYQSFSGSFVIATDDNATAANHIEALRALWRSKVMVCYRDDRGRKFFGHITKFKEVDARTSMYEVSMTITETNYQEGV